MATQRRTAELQTIYRTTQKNSYIHGSLAPKVEPIPQKRPYRDEERRPNRSPQKKERVAAKAVPVNKPLLILSLIAFLAIGAMMIQYISLNSEISVLMSNIASLESDLNTLQDENDEYRSRIMNNVNLEKVREVAIMDLGMVYASEEQIITYDSQIDDYVEQSRVVKD